MAVFKDNLTEKYGLKVERSATVSKTNGVLYRDYFIKHKVRSKEVLIHFVPADTDGNDRYSRVDLVFDGVDFAELRRERSTDSVTGRELVSYTLVSDVDGDIVEARVKLKNRSDADVLKSIITNISRKLGITEEEVEAEASDVVEEKKAEAPAAKK